MIESNSKIIKHVEISMISGERHIINELKLYPSNLLHRANKLKEEAETKLRGISTGLGFWGSPGWVVMGSLVLGAIEGSANKSLAQEGLVLLNRAGDFYNKARSNGVFHSISSIDFIECPAPYMWYVNKEIINDCKEEKDRHLDPASSYIIKRQNGFEEVLDQNTLIQYISAGMISPMDQIRDPVSNSWGYAKNDELVKKYSKAEVSNSNVQSSYIHNGDPFIVVKNTNGDEYCIMLDKIEKYTAVAMV